MPNVGENWKCPYCGHAQVISVERYSNDVVHVYKEGLNIGRPAVRMEFVFCANSDCQELTLDATLWTFESRGSGHKEYSGPQKHWPLLPPSSAKPQPDFIPSPLRKDYEEACAIRDLSPKASATITRRCLQGMIRDFCGISKSRLIDEINELRKRVDAGQAPLGVQPDTLIAIDHVRSIGNIGAHMEADINVIVDVDPIEAQKLIELVELLFVEWYVARQSRQQRLKELGIIVQKKKTLKGTKNDSEPTE